MAGNEGYEGSQNGQVMKKAHRPLLTQILIPI